MLFTKAFVGLFSLLFLKYSTSCHYIRVYIIYKANSSSTRQLVTKQIARQLVNLSTNYKANSSSTRQLVNSSTNYKANSSSTCQLVNSSTNY